MASSYGWAAVVLGILGILIALLFALRAMRTRAVSAARARGERTDAEGKAAEHARVADVERRDLPGGVAGSRVRDVPGKLGGTPPGPGRA